MTEDDLQFLYGELSKLGRFTGIDLLRMLAYFVCLANIAGLY